MYNFNFFTNRYQIKLIKNKIFYIENYQQINLKLKFVINKNISTLKIKKNIHTCQAKNPTRLLLTQ